MRDRAARDLAVLGKERVNRKSEEEVATRAGVALQPLPSPERADADYVVVGGTG